MTNDKRQTTNHEIVTENILYGSHPTHANRHGGHQAVRMRIFMNSYLFTIETVEKQKIPKTQNAKYLRKEDYEQFEMKTSISLMDRVYRIAYHLLLFKKFVGIRLRILAWKQNEITPTEFIQNCFRFLSYVAWRQALGAWLLALSSCMHFSFFTIYSSWIIDQPKRICIAACNFLNRQKIYLYRTKINRRKLSLPLPRLFQLSFCIVGYIKLAALSKCVTGEADINQLIVHCAFFRKRTANSIFQCFSILYKTLFILFNAFNKINQKNG